MNKEIWSCENVAINGVALYLSRTALLSEANETNYWGFCRSRAQNYVRKALKCLRTLRKVEYVLKRVKKLMEIGYIC